MNTLKSYFSPQLVVSGGLLLFFSFIFLNSFIPEKSIHAFEEKDDQSAPRISVSSTVPTDIFTDGTPASSANLSQAAAFAWNEFIALNWPAKAGQRDTPDTAAKFGSAANTLVWHTFRHKVEIYPGNGKPPPGFNPNQHDFGYNTASPSYFYDPADVGGSDGQISPCSGTPSSSTPWINLDEKNEIGVATMYAGISASESYPDPQILFLAKANQAEYVYAAKNAWYAGENGFDTAKTNTVNYIDTNGSTPPPNSPNTLVSLPNGTIEIKTAWRRLTAAEKSSGHFYSTTVRYYSRGSDGHPCYVDEEFGMLALHIIQKTPTAPYFIFATFEHTDNILTKSGRAVEDADGNIVNSKNLPPTTPNFKVTNATPHSEQMFSPTQANSDPQKSLYYHNTPDEGLPAGTVTYNRRINSIPPDIIAANNQAHKVIDSYNSRNGVNNSPWPFYKLVNVQYKPIDKPAGVDYTGADSATYYLSNSVVESDYILQKFSGAFSSSGDFTISDYDANGHKIYNAYYQGTKYLMGGCMGCHGNATNGGTDYSFILGKPVSEPEYAEIVTMKEERIKEIMKSLK